MTTTDDKLVLYFLQGDRNPVEHGTRHYDAVYMGALPASKVLELANKTTLINGHFIGNSHYASLGDTPIHFWEQSYSAGRFNRNGCQYLQSLEQSPVSAELVGHSLELRYEF